MSKSRCIHHGGVSVSLGNIKLGGILNLSLPPGKTCALDVPCKNKCYARKAVRLYPSARETWKRNLCSLIYDRDGFFEAIDVILQKQQPERFRWHVAGDILDQDYFDRMVGIAHRHPKVRFLAFTKQHTLDFRKAPKNLRVVLSMWPGWGNLRKKLPRAWMQDGTETRIPKNAIECSGHCEDCQQCWELDKHANVVFHLH